MEEHMEICQRFAKEVINDYFTAKVKAEVIIDTILTPVIGEILAVCMQKEKVKLLAKEFPILKEKEKSYRPCNADYLMCDDKTVYLVELKTSMDSDDKEQRAIYIRYCGDKEFSKELGKDFICLLNHVYKFGKSDRKLKIELNKKLKTPDKDWYPKRDCLKRLFETITKDYAIEEEKYVPRAICYLQREKASSSKKYLFTAGQMLDCMEGDAWQKYNWWEYKNIKLLYLTPEELGEPNSDDVKYLTFEEVIKKRKEIGEKIEKKDLKDYWEWAADILERCMNCYALRLKSECPKHKKGCELECGRQTENRE